MSRNTITFRLLRRLNSALQDIRWQNYLNHMRTHATVDASALLAPTASIDNCRAEPDAIHIGSHSQIHGNLLVYRHGGKIRLGSYVFVGPGSRIWSSVSVTIGNHVLISHNVNIHDNDSHSVDMETRRAHTQFILDQKALPATSYGTKEAAIVIGDDVWIGLNAVILKGVSIGQGAIIAAGAIVTRNVDAFTLVAGNPATFKKKLI
jgi:acetyltransferase-like isoleucine patch superfamily enzyme